MPCFPNPGTVTICEINRDLITADVLSDDRAKETYGKLIGMVFSPVPFQSEEPDHQETEQGGRRNGETEGFLSTLLGLKRIFYPNHVNLLPEVDLQGVSWHQYKNIIAFISGTNQVIVRDFEDSEGKDPCILTSESQRNVQVLEWRPNGGRSLSIGCKGGICIWAASYPGNAASVRSGAASFLGTLSRGSGTRWTLVDFLQSENGEHITGLSWSPDGRWLASASYESSSFTIWDVAQGLGVPIRRGLAGISMLKWSPTGDYFFSAKFDGTFYLWETNLWTSEPWSSTSGFVKGATWDPEGRMILLAFSGSSTLGSIHFASKPPSLDAHLLPVDLPEILSLTGSGFIRGPGDYPKPLTFAFHDKFKQGPLLSVCWSSGFCCTYPLIFQSHVLP
ncbi:aladin isoform X2 [Mangifera indica]|uniref:aladin isoform X2 n=1 Tax=Mangifera indica TaxID=29780 RepID=UPI001CF945FF|nr:aladin isoform X2 [Mangifera indica]